MDWIFFIAAAVLGIGYINTHTHTHPQKNEKSHHKSVFLRRVVTTFEQTTISTKLGRKVVKKSNTVFTEHIVLHLDEKNLA